MTTAGAGGAKRIFRDVASFATSQYALRIASLIKGFAIARVLGPAGNGIWQHIQLIFEYSQHAQVGILPGLSKDLGHSIGRGDDERIRRARNTGLTGIVGSALLAWAALVVWVVVKGDEMAPVERIGLPILGFIVVMEQVTHTYRALLRAYSRITVISTVAVVFAVSNLVISLAVLPGYRILGLMVSWAVTRAVTTIWLVVKSGYRPEFDFHGPTLRRIVATGFPIYLFHLTNAALRNIDRVLVDAVLEKADLGIYGIAVTLATLVRYGADAVGFVIYPIFLRTFGETADPTTLRDHLEKPVAFIGLFVPIVLGLGWLLMHLPIQWLLPQYEPSVEIFRLLTVPMFFSCLAILPGFFMMAIDKQNWLVPLGLGVVALNFGLGREMIERGFGLPGVAAATGIGLGIHSTVVLMISGRFAMGSLGAASAWILKLYVPVAYMGAVLWGIRWLSPQSPWATWSDVSRAAIEALAFLALTAPILLAFERRHQFVARILKRARS